ncbi:site-specific integrase [Brevundimonas sp. SL161]|uniref:site-specific integrase n=1 Tax=Brevundimonas sp. SL161 TaxID=2804613 RepID=UPI003CF4BAA1
MSSNKSITPLEAKALIDDWLRAELDEDSYLRTAPEGEIHIGVILHRQPPGQSDSIVAYLDHSELTELNELEPEERTKRLGPTGYVLTGVSELDLRRAARDKLFQGADERHRSGADEVATRDLDAALKRAGISLSPFSETYETATKRMVRAHQDVLTSIKRRDQAEWRPDLDDDPVADLLAKLAPRTAVSVDMKGSGTTLTLSEAATAAIAEMSRTEEFKPKRIEDYRNAVAVFILWRGHDPLLTSISGLDAGSFKTALSHYPANANKRPGYRNLKTFRERSERAAAVSEERLLGAVTINGKYLTPLRRIVDWQAGVGVGAAADNPFKGIVMKKPRRVDVHEQRRDFSTAELQRFFDRPLFTGSEGLRQAALNRPGTFRVQDWRFWVPLICVFTGMRLNEACGLSLADIKVQNDIVFFHVRDEAEGQSAKGNASRRKVPLHHELVTLGLIEWVAKRREAGGERLFDELNVDKHGYFSREPSKFLGRQMAGIEDADPDEPGKLVFHSTRHTVTSRLRAAEVRKDVAEEIVGHEKGDTHSGYGTYDMATLKAAIDKMVYPGLDLSRLMMPETVMS